MKKKLDQKIKFHHLKFFNLCVIIFLSNITFAQKNLNIDGVTYHIESKSSEYAIVTSIYEQEEVNIMPEVSFEYNRQTYTYPVVEIGNYACQNKYIKKLAIPSSIKKIGIEAFKNAEIYELYIEDLISWCNINFEYNFNSGNSITEDFKSYASPFCVKTRLFVSGNEVTDLVIPEEITEIPPFCFNNFNCNSVDTGFGVKRIGEKSFEKSGVTNLYLRENVTEIAPRAFQGCKFLKFINSDGNGFLLGVHAFYDCDFIRSITVPSLEAWLNISYNYRALSSYPYLDVPFGKNYDIVINNEKLENVIVPEGYEKLNDFCFAGSSIKSLTCNEGLRDTGLFTLNECQYLERVSFPSSLEKFGCEFDGCNQLKTLELNSSTPPELSVCSYTNNSVFNFSEHYIYIDLSKIYYSCELLVPYDYYNDYKMENPWKNFYRIRCITNSGIKPSINDSEEIVIYTLQGTKVKDLTNIPNGIYIINGKKTIITH